MYCAAPGSWPASRIASSSARALSVACDKALLGDSARALLDAMLAEHARYCEAAGSVIA